MKRLLAAVLMTVMLAGCGGAGYHVHTNSINTFDSQTADTLLQIKTLLDNSKNSLTDAQRPLWSALAEAYDAAYPVYFQWRALAKEGKDASAQQQLLAISLSNLMKALAAYQGVQ